MENKDKNKRKSLSSYLLPNKTPNKVGVAVSRSQSAKDQSLRYLTSSEAKSNIAISKRPLSFDIKRRTMNGKAGLCISNVSKIIKCLMLFFLTSFVEFK